MSEVVERGTVVSYFAKRGFGFIRPAGGDGDVYVHASRLHRSGIARIRAGDRVEFERIRGYAGEEAIRPRLLGPGP